MEFDQTPDIVTTLRALIRHRGHPRLLIVSRGDFEKLLDLDGWLVPSITGPDGLRCLHTDIFQHPPRGRVDVSGERIFGE